MKYRLGDLRKRLLMKIGNNMCKQLFCLIILLCLLPSWASAFDNKETHRILTKEAIKQTEHFDDILKMQLGFEDVDAELSSGKDTHSGYGVRS